MSRYRGPRIRIIRRLDLYDTLRGLTRKKTWREKTAGQHGKPRKNPFLKDRKDIPKKPPQYRIRLQEKQKLRFNYGITESQLINYVRQAKKSKGSTGETLLELLEMRVDNVVFRLGMAPTIPAARQLITHGHVLINDKKVTIPSYQCKPNDTISSKKKKQSQDLIDRYLKNSYRTPPHLVLNKKRGIGTVKNTITRRWVSVKVKELLVVEYYSRQV